MLAVLLLFALGTLRAQQIEEGADAPPRGAGVHTLVDRFGYPWFPDPAIVARLSDAASDPAVADCSGFTLYFEDVALANRIGFDDPALGSVRRETACAVFAYLASIIDLKGTRPDIIIQASEIDGTGPLGVGSPFYAAVTPPGFVGGLLRDHIVLGSDPTPALGAFDARIRIDFGSRQDGVVTIHSDYRTPAGGEVDLYSVILHETTHALGFNTLIGSGGASLLGGAYSIFDRYLEYNGTPLIDPVTLRFQATPTALVSDQLRYNHPANSRPQSVYSPLVYSPGSSLAHFDGRRDADHYVMRPSTAGGEDRRLGQPELDVLCNLGYTLRDALCSDRYPVGNDDAGSTDPGVTVCIDVLLNDRDPDGDPITIDPASIEIVNGGGSVNVVGGRLCYTPSPAFRGTAYLRYAPTDGKRRGNPAAVLVTVIGGGGCPDDPCNYLCNGGFEGGTSNTADLDFDSMEPCPSKVDNWCGAEGTPDLYVRGAINTNFGIPVNTMARQAPAGEVNTWDFPNPKNNRYIGMLWDGFNNFNEGVYGRLVRPLQPGHTYTFRMHALTVSNCGRCPGIDDVMELMLDTARPSWRTGPGLGEHVVATFVSPNVTVSGGGWELLQGTFTATRADDYLIIRARPGQSGNSRIYTYIDDVSLTEGEGTSLRMTIAVDNPTPARRGTVAYTIEVCNPGTETVTGVTIEDILPRGLTYSGGFSAYPRHLVGDLAPGECRTVTLTATVDPDAPVNTTLTNCAGFASGGSLCAALADAGNCVDVTIPATDIAVTKVVAITPSALGGTVGYAVTITNLGPADAHHVVVRDLLPAGLVYSSHAITRGAYDNATGLCTIPLLRAGEAATMSLTAVALRDTENCAALVSLDEVDLNSENDAACAPLLLGGTRTNISLAKKVDISTPAAGDRIVYTIIARNTAGSDAHNVVVRDLLPPGVSYVSHTATIGTYLPTTGVLSIPLLRGGEDARLAITVDAVSSCTNCAELMGLDEQDTAAGDDRSCVDIVVAPARPLVSIGVDKRVDRPLVPSGTSVSYTIRVTNGGPSDAHDVVVRDILPSGNSYRSHAITGGTYDPATGLCAIPLLRGGETAALTITASVTADAVNCARLIGTAERDADASDDESCADVRIVGPGSRLSLRWRDASASIGADVSLLLAIERDGDSTEGLHLRSDVRFDASALRSIDLRSLRAGLTAGIVAERIDGRERVVTIDLLGALPLAGDIAELRCTALLGERDSARVSFAGTALESVVTGMALPVSDTVAGTFHLLGACPAGGVRLVGVGGMPKLGALRPSPLSLLSTVDVTTVEDGMVRLSVVDPLGRRVAMPLDGALPAGEHRVAIDGSMLPSGVYWLVLDTPSRRVRERIVVVR